jgi:hypothetical protein
MPGGHVPLKKHGLYSGNDRRRALWKIFVQRFLFSMNRCLSLSTFGAQTIKNTTNHVPPSSSTSNVRAAAAVRTIRRHLKKDTGQCLWSFFKKALMRAITLPGQVPDTTTLKAWGVHIMKNTFIMFPPPCESHEGHVGSVVRERDQCAVQTPALQGLL